METMSNRVKMEQEAIAAIMMLTQEQLIELLETFNKG